MDTFKVWWTFNDHFITGSLLSLRVKKLKIDQHLPKLWAIKYGGRFFMKHGVDSFWRKIWVKSVENYKNGISSDLFVCIGCILIDVVRCSTTSWNFLNISEIYDEIFHEIFEGKKSWNFTSLSAPTNMLDRNFVELTQHDLMFSWIHPPG